KGDGAITVSALFCDQKPAYLNYDRGHLQFGLRTRAGDIEHVSLVTSGNAYPMAEVSSDEFYTKYRAEIPWDRKQNLGYQFKLEDGGPAQFFGLNGLTTQEAGNTFTVDASSLNPFDVVTWPERSVVSQIFPDRFANDYAISDPPG